MLAVAGGDRDCPRCGASLSRYSLGERETVGCEACEYAGMVADHASTSRELESWDEALERFRGR